MISASLIASLAGSLLMSASMTSAIALVSDPFNGSISPKSIPGSLEDCTLTVVNLGAAALDTGTVVIISPIPTNTKLFVGDLGAVGSGPIAFSQGVIPSGLSSTFTNLSSTTDDVQFSNNSGVSYNYSPISTGGYDAAVTNIRITTHGAAAVAGSYKIRFRVAVK